MTSAVQSVSATVAAQTTATANAVSAESNRLISSDFQTFLEMLTAQMNNQDPLNPIDSSDYASQLATFSAVEQQVQTNELLSGLVAQMSQMGISQLAGWVGMDARSAAPVSFTGNAITLSPLPAAQADEAWIVVRDSDGTELDRFEIALDGADITWDGTKSDGNQLPDGIYSFEVENHAEGSLLGATAVEHYATVTEVQAIDGLQIIMLEGGIQVLATDVIALRNPA